MITMTDVKCFMHPYTCQNPFLFPHETSFFGLASDRTCVAELLLDVDVVAVTELVVVATWGQHEVRGTPPLSITNVNMNCLKLRPLGLLHVATSENKTLRPP